MFAFMIVALLIATIAATLILVRRESLQHQRWLHNLCLACGYDLRFDVTGRCPECGKRQRFSSAGDQ